ncbi:MAG: hypothetical protein ACRC6I_20235 [Paracoccaceae bacterium]
MGTQVRLEVMVGRVGLQAVLRPDEAGGIGVGDAVTLRLPVEALWVLG